MEHVAAGAAGAFTIMFLFVLCLLLIEIERRQELRRMQEREAELQGLKASHTDPKREIVV